MYKDMYDCMMMCILLQGTVQDLGEIGHQVHFWSLFILDFD